MKYFFEVKLRSHLSDQSVLILYLILTNQMPEISVYAKNLYIFVIMGPDL